MTINFDNNTNNCDDYDGDDDNEIDNVALITAFPTSPESVYQSKFPRFHKHSNRLDRQATFSKRTSCLIKKLLAVKLWG